MAKVSDLYCQFLWRKLSGGSDAGVEFVSQLQFPFRLLACMIHCGSQGNREVILEPLELVLRNKEGNGSVVIHLRCVQLVK